MKRFKSFLAILLCIGLVAGFCSCSGKKEKEETPTDTNRETEYTENWVIEPSVEAEAIFTLPLTRFNGETNHYDVTFGDCYVIKKDGKFGFINSNGEIVVEPVYDTIETCICSEGYIASIKPEDSYRTTYDIDSSLSRSWRYPHECEAFDGYTYKWNSVLEKLTIQKGETQTQDGALLPEAVQLDNGKYGLLSGDKLVGASDYDAAGVFTGGLVAMAKGDKWGYVNSKGEEVIPFEFDAIEGYSALGVASTPYECSEGYVTVLKNGKYGVFSADGTQIIPCKYQSLTTVHDGRVFASNDGGAWGILLVDEKVSNGIATGLTTQSDDEENE